MVTHLNHILRFIKYIFIFIFMLFGFIFGFGYKYKYNRLESDGWTLRLGRRPS